MPRSAAGSTRSSAPTTCSSSPPTTASTRGAPHTDHTREYAPLLAVFAGDGGRRHDGPLADVGASTLDWLTGRDAPALPGDELRRRVSATGRKRRRGRAAVG